MSTRTKHRRNSSGLLERHLQRPCQTLSWFMHQTLPVNHHCRLKARLRKVLCRSLAYACVHPATRFQQNRRCQSPLDVRAAKDTHKDVFHRLSIVRDKVGLQ